eukprot:Plantae.Rhodophyta-Hildenbrandia_rubra.ctg8863.p1 GENE.Plantae.Rhodophyta-Hildenbrandia_rubra.ctg8863~~Plantae.Rhodophyta-Hildenbrandia_rubra.ctg8863.p1  ORF type:complete len:675 (+),score=69.21 Plantae.Rhodophyta-Hildenbrandia_rubra.ctg8863:3026-5050(+)
MKTNYSFVPSTFKGSVVNSLGSSITPFPPARKIATAADHSLPTMKVSQPAPVPVVKKPKPAEKQQAKPDLLHDLNIFKFALGNVVENTAEKLFHVAKDWKEWDAIVKKGDIPQYAYADYEGTEHGELPKYAKGLPKSENFNPQTVGMLAKRGFEYAMAQMPFVARLGAGSFNVKGLLNGDIYRSVFETKDTLREPSYLTEKDWCDVSDDVFVNQFINGCNPVVIQYATEQYQIPDDFKSVKTETGESCEDLHKDGRLFFADYKLLAEKGVGEWQEGGYFTRTMQKARKVFYAPLVMFYKDNNGKLKLLGIRLTRKKDGSNDIYSQTTCRNKKVLYAYAKMHVACADNNYHQFVSHLGLGHLTYEPFSIAYQNIFGLNPKHKNHVVGKLLSSHFEGAIAINWLARETLVASRKDATPLTDAPFAVGSQGALAMLKHVYKDWNFKNDAFPKLLRSRGFTKTNDCGSWNDGLRDYYYRDDGMALWTALEKYISSVIENEYGRGTEADIKIRDDDVLKKWCSELTDKAGVKTFYEKFESTEQLVEAITTIIFHVSAQHAAMNFSQLEYLSYVPNRPNALFKEVPGVRSEDMKRDDIFKIWQLGGASQSLTFMHFQVQFAYLLSSPCPKSLMNLNSPFVCEYKELQKDFEALHQNIVKRKGKVNYPFLDPYKVPPSINI